MPIEIAKGGTGDGSTVNGAPPFTDDEATQDRDWLRAIGRGFANRCPSCGQGLLYHRFLKVVDTCDHCGTELHHQRADDAPPYITMFITGHILVGGLLSLEQSYSPPTWVHIVIWIPLAVLLSAWLLPRVKGAIIAIQWAHRMHGFGDDVDPDGDDVGMLTPSSELSRSRGSEI